MQGIQICGLFRCGMHHLGVKIEKDGKSFGLKGRAGKLKKWGVVL